MNVFKECGTILNMDKRANKITTKTQRFTTGKQSAELKFPSFFLLNIYVHKSKKMKSTVDTMQSSVSIQSRLDGHSHAEKVNVLFFSCPVQTSMLRKKITVKSKRNKAKEKRKTRYVEKQNKYNLFFFLGENGTMS